MRLDEYRRVAQVNGREGEGFQSPELQSKSIAAYARVHGHAVMPNPVELDVSGSKLKRPILDKIIARIRNGESDGIIVNDLDRYSRDALGANLRGHTWVQAHSRRSRATASWSEPFGRACRVLSLSALRA